MEEDIRVETSGTSDGGAACTTCAAHTQKATANEEISLAFLLALTPVLALTFFGQVGLL